MVCAFGLLLLFMHSKHGLDGRSLMLLQQRQANRLVQHPAARWRSLEVLSTTATTCNSTADAVKVLAALLCSRSCQRAQIKAIIKI
jgi:hypothetical protein